MDAIGIELTFASDERVDLFDTHLTMGKRPYLLDVTSLLYDFELLHDFSLFLWTPEYRDFRFSNFFWYRKKRPIRDEHRLRVKKIQMESPLLVTVIVSSLVLLSGAFWAWIQTFEKAVNFPLNRRRLKAEIKNLEIRNRILRLQEEMTRLEYEDKLREREALDMEGKFVKRFGENPLKIRDIRLLSVEETDDNEG